MRRRLLVLDGMQMRRRRGRTLAVGRRLHGFSDTSLREAQVSTAFALAFLVYSSRVYSRSALLVHFCHTESGGTRARRTRNHPELRGATAEYASNAQRFLCCLWTRASRANSASPRRAPRAVWMHGRQPVLLLCPQRRCDTGRGLTESLLKRISITRVHS